MGPTQDQLLILLSGRERATFRGRICSGRAGYGYAVLGILGSEAGRGGEKWFGCRGQIGRHGRPNRGVLLPDETGQ